MQEIFLHSMINFNSNGRQINMKYDYLVVGIGIYGEIYRLWNRSALQAFV